MTTLSGGKRPSSRHRKPRDREAIKKAILDTAGRTGVPTCPPKAPKTVVQERPSSPGLKLRDLEERRWNVSPQVAKAKLLQSGLPYEGRRAGLIYSWASILRAEGINQVLAEEVTEHDHPALFDDLMSTTDAMQLLGYQDPSAVRKLIAAGALGTEAYVQFGSRGIYRFRPASLRSLRKTAAFSGRVV
ncbi:MAG: hypothetical protein CMJ75_14240 [Planctomycetaceae bacterium]|nr:hypothetical protein [Planctomycetaceae bacterium]